MRRTVCTVACLSLLIGGCASTSSTWTPQIDAQNVNQAKYQQDFAECKKYAESNPDANAGKSAKNGALAMGAVGGVALVGMTIATGGLALLPAIAMASVPALGTGVVMGAAGGAAVADAKYKDVISRCLAGRGYHVLD
jgi:hypothetical protein